jgi:hypothetical protein
MKVRSLVSYCSPEDDFFFVVTILNRCNYTFPVAGSFACNPVESDSCICKHVLVSHNPGPLANAGKPAGPAVCEHMTIGVSIGSSFRRLGRLQPQTAAAR